MIRARASSEPAAAPEIELSLHDISDLFNAPRVDPFSPNPLDGCGVSGVDYLLSVLHMDKALQQASVLTLVLPAAKAAACTADSVTAALRRYVQLQVQHETRELRNSYRYGWRVAGFSVVMLAICLGLSALFASDLTEWMNPLLRTLFEAGSEITGWVMLWHPIEVLVFAPVAIRVRLAALQTLATLKVVIGAAPGQPEL